MRTRATDNGHVDAFHGARALYVARERAKQGGRGSSHLVAAEVDIGEPERPVVTLAFLVAALLVTAWEFMTFGASPDPSELARAGGVSVGAIATGAWWKLLTANLLHGNVPHLLMNAFVIYLTGRWLEHLAGRTVVATTIAWAALVSSVGALVVGAGVVTIGASGVAFGLVGCALGVDPKARTATGVIARQLALVNVIATFLIPGISIGGHVGGLLAGLLVGSLCWRRPASAGAPAGRPRRRVALALAAAAALLMLMLAIGPAAVPAEARRARGQLAASLLERQLSGATLSGGLEVEAARCVPTDDPLLYECSVDGEPGIVRFDRDDDQWGLLLGAERDAG